MKFRWFPPPEWQPPKDCKFVLLYFYYKLKHDLRKNARLVAGRNRIDSSMHKSSLSMACNASIRALLVIAAANNLTIRVGDIENAYI